MKYRSRTDIIDMILHAAIDGGTKTRLMYDSRLSFTQIGEYIEFLTERGLIQVGPDQAVRTHHEYKPTEKGLHFIRAYDEISAIVSLDGVKASEKFGPAPSGWLVAQ